MNFSSVYDRQRRNLNQMYHPMHSSVANYWTEALHKSEMKQELADDYYLNNFHFIPDPLKKNLADTLITNDKPKKPENIPSTEHRMPLHTLNMSLDSPSKVESTGSKLSGIGNFFSGVINVLSGVMFRTRSPVSYYDCFDDSHQGSPQPWQYAKTNDQDKNGQPARDRKKCDVPPSPNLSTDMNLDSRTVTNCEKKVNQVLNLLVPKNTSSPIWVRKRPKKVFIEPGSVSDSFEDAFSPEDFINLPDDSYIEYYSPVQYQNGDLFETAAHKTLIQTPPHTENMEIVADVVNKKDLELKKDDCTSKMDLEEEQNKLQLEKNTPHLDKQSLESDLSNLSLNQHTMNLEKTGVELTNENLAEEPLEVDKSTGDISNKFELVSTCEDKLSKLKALLSEKRKKNMKSRQYIPETSQTMEDSKGIPIDNKPADKQYKNPCRRTDKRRKSKLKCKIDDDLLFANEISLETPPSIENSPMSRPQPNFGEYFDEVSGRFRSGSIGSEDSFQIVFNDSPKQGRTRTTSDCDSEDSFIVFEDSPESCYMSNDVFGESDDSDTDVSDSGCGMMTCKLAHTLTRTVSNLADDSLYVESEDEVDFANIETTSAVDVKVNTGLLLNDKKKLLRKDLPAKKVHFSTAPPKVHVMRVWAFAAKQARAGHWERYAIDRERFKRRIADVDVAVSWVLKPQHRKRVMFQRFMPWWNQLKRKELAEKKEREAQEKIKQEELQREQEKEKEKDEEKTVEESKENLDGNDLNEIDTLDNRNVNYTVQKEELKTDIAKEEYNNNKGDSKEKQ